VRIAAQCASQSATRALRVYETSGTEHLLLYAKQVPKIGRTGYSSLLNCTYFKLQDGKGGIRQQCPVQDLNKLDDR
jgi:hypothetical protein